MKDGPLYRCSSSMMTSTGSGSAPLSADPWTELVGPISRALATVVADLGAPTTPELVVAQLDWAGGDHGDVAWAVHRAAKAAGTAPADLARHVCERIGPIPGVARCVAVDGFVNIATDLAWLAHATLDRVFQRGPKWGHLEPRDPTVCVEHTSANPTGPFHVGRVRNAIIGDTLSRILGAAGSPVTTQYYVDDVGRQAAMISWIWSKPPSEWPAEILASLPEGKDDPTLRPDLRYGRPYPFVSRYLKEHPAAAEEVAEISRRLERHEEPPNHHALAEAVLGGMVRSLARISITFDEFVWESSFLKSGAVDRVVARLRAAPHAVQEENGAWAIDATEYHLPKESAHVIVTRSDGSTLYPVRDVAYHLDKFARFARVIDVLGQDHHLHAKTLGVLLAEIGEPRRPEFVIYQDITVPEGGRMSTRAGKVVYLDELLDEATGRARTEVVVRHPEWNVEEVDAIARSVAAAAVRYHIGRVAPEKTVAFRWEDALSFEGRSGPFLQYSYARASSLLRKAEAVDAPRSYDPSQFATPPERALLREISRLPATVEYAARTTHVHALAGYAHSLAEAFNRFYESTPVLTADAPRASRLALVAATRTTLANSLQLLGIDPLERM
jgi:arginyl-tRNA synthetase